MNGLDPLKKLVAEKLGIVQKEDATVILKIAIEECMQTPLIRERHAEGILASIVQFLTRQDQKVTLSNIARNTWNRSTYNKHKKIVGVCLQVLQKHGIVLESIIDGKCYYKLRST